MELAMPPEPKDVFVSEGVLHVGPMRRVYFPRMLVQSEGWLREQKKLTLAKAQIYLKAGKSKKSAMLDEYCESPGTAGDMRPVS